MSNGAEEVVTSQDAVQDLSQEEFWRVPLQFAVHAIVGSVIFGIIAIPAILLDLGVHWLEVNYSVSVIIASGLKVAECALFGTDLWLYLVFLLRTAKRTIGTL